MLSIAALEAIQADAMADDVPIDLEKMSRWSEEAVRIYFESGGQIAPSSEPPAAVHALERESRSNDDSDGSDTLEIGGVSLAVRNAVLAPECVPYLPRADADSAAAAGSVAIAETQSALDTARWMMMQIALGQDMLLLGDPGPRMRQIALWLCALLRREVEYIGVTRDTAEADLKQRRELIDGTVRYADAPPLRAAVRGRVLILEGVEKARSSPAGWHAAWHTAPSTRSSRVRKRWRAVRRRSGTCCRC